MVDEAAGETGHGLPQFLPGGGQLLYNVGTMEGPTTRVLSVATGESRRVFDRGQQVSYALSGHLLFVENDILMAAAFDASRLAVESEPQPVLTGIVSKRLGHADVVVSPTGRLAFISGASGDPERRRLAWVDREGTVETLAMEPGEYWHLEISPDGTRAAYEQLAAGSRDIWLWDFARGQRERFTSHAALDGHPVWSDDGSQIFFGSGRHGGGPNLYSKAASGAGEVRRLTESPSAQLPMSASPDGRWLLFQQLDEGETQDLYLLALDSGEVRPLLVTEFDERGGAISPDSRWFVYHSNESGENVNEVYVRPFPDAGDGRTQVSDRGGCCAVWARDGSEIFYRRLDENSVYSVPVESSEPFRVGAPRKLFEWDSWGFAYATAYDVSPDGRLLGSLPVQESEAPNRVVVFENWLEELKRLVPLD